MQFFEMSSWFKFNTLGLALNMALKFQNSVAKWLQLKVRKFFFDRTPSLAKSKIF